jgi:hypothetical protein
MWSDHFNLSQLLISFFVARLIVHENFRASVCRQQSSEENPDDIENMTGIVLR